MLTKNGVQYVQHSGIEPTQESPAMASFIPTSKNVFTSDPLLLSGISEALDRYFSSSIDKSILEKMANKILKDFISSSKEKYILKKNNSSFKKICKAFRLTPKDHAEIIIFPNGTFKEI